MPNNITCTSDDLALALPVITRVERWQKKLLAVWLEGFNSPVLVTDTELRWYRKFHRCCVEQLLTVFAPVVKRDVWLRQVNRAIDRASAEGKR